MPTQHHAQKEKTMNEIEQLADRLERLLGDEKHEHIFQLPGGRVLQVLRLRQGERPEINSTGSGR